MAYMMVPLYRNSFRREGLIIVTSSLYRKWQAAAACHPDRNRAHQYLSTELLVVDSFAREWAKNSSCSVLPTTDDVEAYLDEFLRLYGWSRGLPAQSSLLKSSEEALPLVASR